MHPAGKYVTDLQNFVVPSRVTALHSHASVALSDHWTGNFTEWGAYVGLPLIVFLVLAVIVARRRPLVWVGSSIVIVTGIFSLGSELHIAGRPNGIPLPWALLAHLPLLRNVLPSRFASMMFLGIALMVAVAFDELARRRKAGRLAGWASGLVAMASVIPIVPLPAVTVLRSLAFAEKRVCPERSGSVILVQPSSAEDPLLWQVESGFCFRMPTAAGITESRAVPIAQELVLMRASSDARYGWPLPVLTPSAPAAQQELATWRVQELVLGPQPATGDPDANQRLTPWLTELLGSRARHVGDSLVWSHPRVAPYAGGRLRPRG